MLRAEFIILMRRLQSGDIGALAPLYEEYFQKMYSTVLVMLHSAEDAYDVATAAILKLADYRGDPAKIKNPVGYLIGMSANEAKNFLRRRKREVSSDISELPAGYGMEMPSEMLWLDDLMRLFTQEESDVFLLHVVWGIELKKVAIRLGISYSTAKMRKRAIRQKILTYELSDYKNE